jgi:hypothetical protein
MQYQSKLSELCWELPVSVEICNERNITWNLCFLFDDALPSICNIGDRNKHDFEKRMGVTVQECIIPHFKTVPQNIDSSYVSYIYVSINQIWYYGRGPHWRGFRHLKVLKFLVQVSQKNFGNPQRKIISIRIEDHSSYRIKVFALDKA